HREQGFDGDRAHRDSVAVVEIVKGFVVELLEQELRARLALFGERALLEQRVEAAGELEALVAFAVARALQQVQRRRGGGRQLGVRRRGRFGDVLPVVLAHSPKRIAKGWRSCPLRPAPKSTLV